MYLNVLCVLCSPADPYIQPQMNTVPIIITTVIASCVIVFIIIPLLIFACIKSIQRKEEKVERREALQRSLHASKASLCSIQRPSLNRLNPARVENEINTMAARPLLSAPYGNDTFDDVSVNASTMASVAAADIEPLHPVGPRRGSRPRLNLVSEASYRSGDESDSRETRVRPPRPKPKSRDTTV